MRELLGFCFFSLSEKFKNSVECRGGSSYFNPRPPNETLSELRKWSDFIQNVKDGL